MIKAAVSEILRRYSKGALLLAGVAALLMSLLDGAWCYVAAFIACVVALAVCGRVRWALALTVLNPFTLAVLWAMGSYFLGSARLWSHGLVSGNGFEELDRETRLPTLSRGCWDRGIEQELDRVQNMTLRRCTSAFGIMHGAPRGPYPEKEELLSGWETAEKLNPSELSSGLLTVAGVPRRIGHPQGFPERVADWAETIGRSGEESAAPPLEVMARDFGEGSFAVRIRWASPETGSNRDVIALFGGEPLQLFGVFPGPDHGRR